MSGLGKPGWVGGGSAKKRHPSGAFRRPQVPNPTFGTPTESKPRAVLVTVLVMLLLPIPLVWMNKVETVSVTQNTWERGTEGRRQWEEPKLYFVKSQSVAYDPRAPSPLRVM